MKPLRGTERTPRISLRKRKAPDGEDIRALAALPYSFITMWLAATAPALTRENAPGKKVLVNGAAGGLGTLALQTLSEWGACATAVAKASDLDACIAAGAAEVVDRDRQPLSKLAGRFDATRRSCLACARARSVTRRPFIP